MFKNIKNKLKSSAKYKKTKRIKSLRRLIKKTKKRIPLKRRFYIRELYYPSWTSFGMVVFFVLLFFILINFVEVPRFFCFRNITLAKINSQNLIKIHAGIGVIIFALVIFIAESMRDDDKKDKARVLLKESFLFPLAVAEIVTFFIFIWGEINFWTVIPIFIVGMLTIYSLAKIVIVLLNRHRFAKKREELLKERVRRCIDLEIDERIGNNILLSQLDERNIKLEFNPLFRAESPGFHKFTTDDRGIIVDVRLDKLNKISEIVEDEANKNGLSFYKESKSNPIYGRECDVQEADTKEYKQLRNRYLIKKYRDPVTEESDTLISIDKTLIKDEKILMKISALVKQSFVVKPEDSFADEVHKDISGVKDQFIDAINNRQSGKIEEFINLYRKIAESFLESISIYGGGYSSKQASQERNTLMGGWEEIRWLSTDIRTILDNAVQARDRLIIRRASFLPISIANRAIRFKDHYLFQEFIQFAELLYYHASEADNQGIKKFISDRSWRYLKETASFYIERQLIKYDIEKKDINTYKDFAVYLFKVFQNLLKRCYENKDEILFEEYKKTVLNLYDHFKPTQARRNSEFIKREIKRDDHTDEKREKLKKELNRQNFLEDVEKEIWIKRNQMLFGLASWILSEYEKNKEDEKIKLFYKSVESAFESKIEKFTEIFIKSHDFDVEDFWGWGWWDINTEGRMVSINILEKLELFYVIKSLSILSSRREDEIRNIELPFNREFAHLIEGAREMQKKLDDISNNPDNWRFILSNEAIEKINSFRYILDKAKENQEAEEIEQKRKKEISETRMEEFKKEVLAEFYEHAGVRSVFKYYGLLKDSFHKKEGISKERFGINIVDDKAVFFDDWHISFLDWGKEYGRTLANGENSFIIGELEQSCKVISDKEFNTILDNNTNLKDVFILTSNVFNWDLIDEYNEFIPKWRRYGSKIKNEFLWGQLRHEDYLIPVFQLYSQGNEEKILILNKRKLGSLLQLTPLNKGEKVDHIKDIFYFNIKSFSEDKVFLEEFMKNQPEWLEKIGDMNEQRKHLAERVLIQIYERFEFSKLKEFEGYCMKINHNS